MSHKRVLHVRQTHPAPRALVLLLGVTLFACSSSKEPAGGENECFPDADGVSDRPATIDVTVTDDAFSKTVINTQNDSTVTFTLTNEGTLPHGFSVGCVDVTAEYPNLPAGCPSVTCFPEESTIDPLMPGASKTVTFVTPVTDNLIYPFQSSAPDDATVPGLNGGQWSLM